jgi:hypothetical protein
MVTIAGHHLSEWLIVTAIVIFILGYIWRLIQTVGIAKTIALPFQILLFVVSIGIVSLVFMFLAAGLPQVIFVVIILAILLAGFKGRKHD